MLTSLMDDPMLQQVETEAQELQQEYDKVWGTVQKVAITQRLDKMRDAEALKAQVDMAQQKEEVLKERIQPWLDEAFMVSSNIEGKENFRG